MGVTADRCGKISGFVPLTTELVGLRLLGFRPIPDRTAARVLIPP